MEFLYLLSFSDNGWGWALLHGASITISLALATLPLGLALGLVIALGTRSEKHWIRRIAVTYTTIFRGIPELLTLYIIYFGGQIALQTMWKFAGFDGTLSISPFLAGMLALGLVLGAFSSEVWVGALAAVARGQHEGAAALGLTRLQSFRLVILPQMVRIALPGLGNNWMVLLKETSLVSVISLHDIKFIASRANITTKEPFVFFSAALLIYLLFSLASAWGLGYAERRLNWGYAR